MLLSDQETEVDLLYYEAISRTVVKLIGETKNSAITIGVHGDWGAGKSSVLKVTSSAFEKDKRTLCLWFNGWAFEGFDDAKTVVIETIVEELRRSGIAQIQVSAFRLRPPASAWILQMVSCCRLNQRCACFVTPSRHHALR